MQINKEILDEIRSHFSTFADPATVVEVSERNVNWLRDNKEHSVGLSWDLDSDYPAILTAGRRITYRQFFASPQMADLRSLAETMSRVIIGVENYVDGEVRIEWTDEIATSETTRGLGAIAKACETEQPDTSTRIVFLRGSAGGGKTALLRQFALLQAQQYASGSARVLYLYVDAQGQSLTRLDQAFAHVTQDLHGKFTYHAVAPLVQLGLLIPIIDGFDELLGVGGYNEAFSSLAWFLDKLRGKGVVITSTRSTFYDYSRLGSAVAGHRSTASKLRFEILPLELLAWSDNDIRQYAESIGISSDQVSAALEDLDDPLSSKRKDPFFVTSAARIIAEGAPPLPSNHVQSLLSGIVYSLVQREASKLRAKNQLEILTTGEHIELLEHFAEEMWWLETRELDRATIHALVELFVEDKGLTADELVIVKARMFSHALLTSATEEDRVTFAHEYYFAYCFAGRAISAILNQDSRLDILARGTVSPVVASELVARLQGTEQATQVLDSLERRKVPVFTKGVVDSNVGEIYASFVRKIPEILSGREIQRCTFYASMFSGTRLSGVRFVSCLFAKTDFSQCRWTEVDFRDCVLESIIIDDETKLQTSGLNSPGVVVGLQYGMVGDVVFNPDEIAQHLSRIGANSTHTGALFQPSPYIEVFRRLLRMLSRASCFSQNDLENRGISRRPEWSAVDTLIKKYDLTEAATISKRGPSPVVRRMKYSVDDVQAAESGKSPHEALVSFWTELRELS